MKLWVTLDDHDAEVEFHTEGERVFLVLDGRRLEADFRRLPDGEVYSLLVDGHSHEVRVRPGPDGLDVAVGAAAMSVDVRHPLEKLLQSTRHSGGAAAGETVTAPMPGVVVRVRVKAGDTVAAGQAVAVVEAMKMQNELPARHGGVVHEVLVKPGDSVSAGQALLRLRTEVA